MSAEDVAALAACRTKCHFWSIQDAVRMRRCEYVRLRESSYVKAFLADVTDKERVLPDTATPKDRERAVREIKDHYRARFRLLMAVWRVEDDVDPAMLRAALKHDLWYLRGTGLEGAEDCPDVALAKYPAVMRAMRAHFIATPTASMPFMAIVNVLRIGLMPGIPLSQAIIGLAMWHLGLADRKEWSTARHSGSHALRGLCTYVAEPLIRITTRPSPDAVPRLEDFVQAARRAAGEYALPPELFLRGAPALLATAWAWACAEKGSGYERSSDVAARLLDAKTHLPAMVRVHRIEYAGMGDLTGLRVLTDPALTSANWREMYAWVFVTAAVMCDVHIEGHRNWDAVYLPAEEGRGPVPPAPPADELHVAVFGDETFK